MRILAAGLTVLALCLSPALALAAESVVLSAAALKSALAERPPEGSTAGDSDKTIRFGTAGAMHDAAVAGQAFDVIILPPGPLDDLVKRGLVDGDTIRPLGTMRLGAAVKRGATHPAIDTEAHFRQTLAGAGSIAFADPDSGATTGVFLARLFERLGLAVQLRPKLRAYPDGQAAMEAVARGEASLGLGQISEAVPVEGLDLLGALPDSVQLRTTYSAGMATNPADRAFAEKTLARLTGPRFQGVLQGQGFELPK